MKALPLTIWGLVLAFFVSMIIMVNQPEENKVSESEKLDKAVVGLFQDLRLSKLAPSNASDPEKYESFKNDVRQSLSKEFDAQLVTAACNFELDKETKGELLSKLESNKSSLGKLAYAVYQPGKISKEQAESLAITVGEEPLSKIVRFHALVESGDSSAYRKVFGEDMIVRIGAVGLFALGAVGIGLAAGIAFLASWKSHRFKGHPFQELSKLGYAYLGAGAAIAFASFQLIIGLVSVAASAEFDSPLVAAGGLAFVGLFLFVLAKFKHGEKPLLERIDQSELPISRQVFIGFLGAAINVPIMAVLFVILMPLILRMNPDHPVSESLTVGTSPVALISVFILAAVVAPIWEELCFRGLLFGGLIGATQKTWLAAILSSFAFAAIHPQGPALWPILAWIGIMGCILTHYTKSLVPAIAMHMVHNGALILIGFAIST